MNGSAPYCSATGSQVDVVRKLNPNFWIDIDAPRANCQPMRIPSTRTETAIASVSHSNALSANRDGGRIRARTAFSSIDICAANAITVDFKPLMDTNAHQYENSRFGRFLIRVHWCSFVVNT